MQPAHEQQTHEEIQLAAYYLWQQRGCPRGEPDVDWFRAEEDLRQPSAQTVIVAVAEVVGSVLGSVAGIAASVGNLIHSE